MAVLQLHSPARLLPPARSLQCADHSATAQLCSPSHGRLHALMSTLTRLQPEPALGDTGKGNLLELAIEAARRRCSVGEISYALERVRAHAPWARTAAAREARVLAAWRGRCGAGTKLPMGWSPVRAAVPGRARAAPVACGPHPCAKHNGRSSAAPRDTGEWLADATGPPAR